MRILRVFATSGPPQRDRIMALDRDGKPLTLDIQPLTLCYSPFTLCYSPFTLASLLLGCDTPFHRQGRGRVGIRRRNDDECGPPASVLHRLHHTVCRAPPLGTVLGVELCGEPLQWDDVRPFRLLFSRLDVSETGRPAESKCRLSGQPIRIPWPVRTRFAWGLAMESGWIAAPLLFRACPGGSSTALASGRPRKMHTLHRQAAFRTWTSRATPN